MGLLDFKLNSSPRPELFSSPSPGLLLAHPWSAQPQSASLPGVPNPECADLPSPRVSLNFPTPECARVPSPRVSLECPTPHSPGVPNPRFSLECPTRSASPECLWSAKPDSGVPKPRVSPECPAPVSTREGGDVRSIFFFFLGWGSLLIPLISQKRAPCLFLGYSWVHILPLGPEL